MKIQLQVWLTVLDVVYHEFRFGKFQGTVHTDRCTASDKTVLSTCVRINKKVCRYTTALLIRTTGMSCDTVVVNTQRELSSQLCWWSTYFPYPVPLPPSQLSDVCNTRKWRGCSCSGWQCPITRSHSVNKLHPYSHSHHNSKPSWQQHS